MIKVEKLLSGVCKVSRVIAPGLLSQTVIYRVRNEISFKPNRMWKLTLLADLRNNKLDRRTYLPAAILNISFCQKKRKLGEDVRKVYFFSSSTENWKTASSHVTEPRTLKKLLLNFFFFKGTPTLTLRTLIEREKCGSVLCLIDIPRLPHFSPLNLMSRIRSSFFHPYSPSPHCQVQLLVLFCELRPRKFVLI